MVRRQPLPLPSRWLFSDERLVPGIAAIAARMPPGSGIVLRDDRRRPAARWRLLRRLARIARARALMLLLADTPEQAWRWGADGVYLRQRHAGQAARARRIGLCVAMPVHDHAEARRARRAGAAIAFISPLHPTRSHPGAAHLDRRRWLALARASRIGAPAPTKTRAAVALGGMNPARARALQRASKASGITPGWAAIDSWMEKAARRDQKRKAVPT
ncbi:MAG: thiamine monophosphate synthase [Sphingopyxis macrogoltabida]|uniref:Thiamine monophosphate synthase n=1 Tax=Sphingopyxis macrogoltabida TaxID=33050 RepID=A0A2W5NAP6_SPHMC|nr:MAG: thiamine monophosphate synthase [Sphingopyxis macrogoltabida]